jgi:hypothetical protein
MVFKEKWVRLFELVLRRPVAGAGAVIKGKFFVAGSQKLGVLRSAESEAG